jgi:Mg2+ and Co2+ transporter CorA
VYNLYEYQGTEIKKIPIEEMNYQKIKWLDLENPTDEELQKVSEITSIPLPDIKAYCDPEEIPRAIEQEHYTVVVFKSSGERRPESFDRTTTSCAFLISERLLITMHQNAIPTFTDIKNLPEQVLQV